MNDLAAIAERLRAVRSAHRRFLSLWAAEHLSRAPAKLDRVAADLERHQAETAVADPFNHDWSLLYRGSILDD